jgi:uncharacterized surface protein with fasciclin (FAS1) repeats
MIKNRIYIGFKLKTKIMKIRKNILLNAILCLMLVSFTACKNDKAQEETETETETTEMESTEEEVTKEVEEQATIAALAMGTESLSTLVTALKTAELAAMFGEPGSYTVFAPTNDAFGALPEGTVESLLKPENKETLQNVLKYHVVASEVMAADLLAAIEDNGGTYTFSTVAGAELSAMVVDGKVMLKDGAGNTAEVVQTDIDASNGVVHVINAVVMAE